MDKIKQQYSSIDGTIKRFLKLQYIFFGVMSVLVLVLVIMIYDVSNNNMLAVDKDGDIVSLSKVSSDDTFIIEADNHVRLFYSRFFTYNRDNYKKQINLGLALCGDSAKRLYETFKSQGWFDSVVNENLVISSMVIGQIQFENIGNNEFLFIAKGVQTVKKGILIEKRNLTIKAKVYGSTRIKKLNPHGLKIDDIVIIDNNKILSSNE